MGKKTKDLIGMKFDRLTIIRKVENVKGRAHFLCKCDCGAYKVIRSDSLRCRHTKSCGCLQKEKVSKDATKHGLVYHPLYQKLYGMIERCENPKRLNYKYYGGKRISICKEWRTSPKSFIKWALKTGWKKGLTIDRIDSNGNYCPENCQWLTQSENTKKANRDRKMKAA
jgi:hypothetical protein